MVFFQLVAVLKEKQIPKAVSNTDLWLVFFSLSLCVWIEWQIYKSFFHLAASYKLNSLLFG